MTFERMTERNLKVGAGILFFCTDDNSMLLLKRSQEASQPGTWNVPGGNVEPGEKLSEAAYRETAEETGSVPEGRAIEMIMTKGSSDDYDWKYAIFVVELSLDAKNTWEPTIALDHENQTHEWFKTGAVPSELHTSIVNLFKAQTPGLDPTNQS